MHFLLKGLWNHRPCELLRAWRWCGNWSILTVCVVFFRYVCEWVLGGSAGSKLLFYSQIGNNCFGVSASSCWKWCKHLYWLLLKLLLLWSFLFSCYESLCISHGIISNLEMVLFTWPPIWCLIDGQFKVRVEETAARSLSALLNNARNLQMKKHFWIL